MTDQGTGWSRREFVGGLTLVASAGLGMRPERAAAEPPPETTKLRLLKEKGRTCWAPQYVAEDLLRAEGFTDVTYVDFPGGAASELLVAAKADISLHFVGPNIIRLDQGDPAVFLAGVHVGCFEVIATERVRRITDLKGKTAGVPDLRGAEYTFFASIAAHVGLTPGKDITWAVNPREESIRLLTEGKIDALLDFPPTPQELRAKKIGHVLVNSAVDRPWSQYFCCLAISSREFVRLASRRDQAGPARDPQGGGHVRPGAGARGTRACRRQVHAPLRLGAPDREGDPVLPVARVRPRGHDSLLCPPPARDRNDQVESPTDHRSGHRLAVLQPAEEGAKGVARVPAVRGDIYRYR